MRTKLLKRWKCGCLALFASDLYFRRGKVAGKGLRIHKCKRCKISDPIINEIIAEERAQKPRADYYGVL